MVPALRPDLPEWQFLGFGVVDLFSEAELLDLSRAGER
jgi:hypothetical protein